MIVTNRRSAATCRWAAPTLFLSAPFWFDAERAPWSCVRDPLPRVLETTEECAACPRWEPWPAHVRASADLVAGRTHLA